ncbi:MULTISPECIES: dihydrodipicolinate synthase family protein [unclassified Paenibacillus]|uniref:dihydrodipicolinate synthase family protein n=1 Tax=unclassified Paenibacillus TaxID=185978 RepID=UPI00268466EA
MNRQSNSPMAGGVWPTMVTPFTAGGEIDYEAQARAVEWYIAHGVNGLFAVCQSSEMFHLSLEERVKLAAFIKEKAAGRVPVIASGHISDDFAEQVRELNAMAGTGIDALVLITNRLAREEEGDDVWRRNLERLLKELPEQIPLGFYECPYPYKRLISPELLRWSAGTGRFCFLKDTSCDTGNIRFKLEATRDSGLKIYNANTATLLETLELGVHGYSGVMANFQPDLYVWLLQNWREQPEKADELTGFLSMTSLIEKQLYPVNAKYFLMLEGIFGNYGCRVKDHRSFTETNRLEVRQLRDLSRRISGQLSL